MRLSELSPRWITGENCDLLTFFCPCCKEFYLTIKTPGKISEKTMVRLLEQEFGETWNEFVVPCNPNADWRCVGDLDSMTITPSVDATASGHWHGFVTNGDIV